jgi:hypothetical protein
MTGFITRVAGGILGTIGIKVHESPLVDVHRREGVVYLHRLLTGGETTQLRILQPKIGFDEFGRNSKTEERWGRVVTERSSVCHFMQGGLYCCMANKNQRRFRRRRFINAFELSRGLSYRLPGNGIYKQQLTLIMGLLERRGDLFNFAHLFRDVSSSL